MSETATLPNEPNEPVRVDHLVQQKTAQALHTRPWARMSVASRGQTLFEYALIILFVVLAVVLSLTLIAPALNNIFNQVPNAF